MRLAWDDIGAERESGILLIADHASDYVPPDIALGIAPALLSTHIAVDLGVRALGERLCATLDCPGIFGAVSRLVIDYNREEDAPNLIPHESDGEQVPGNMIDMGQRRSRIARFWRPYHDHIAERIAAARPSLIVSLHSFTPRLASKPGEQRPWQIGVLYNRDDRAARDAIPLLEAAGVVTGDQLPYSGVLLNATMNRHAEANGIAYLGLEVRQDLIADDAGIDAWAARLVPIVQTCACRAAERR